MIRLSSFTAKLTLSLSCSLDGGLSCAETRSRNFSQPVSLLSSYNEGTSEGLTEPDFRSGPLWRERRISLASLRGATAFLLGLTKRGAPCITAPTEVNGGGVNFNLRG